MLSSEAEENPSIYVTEQRLLWNTFFEEEARSGNEWVMPLLRIRLVIEIRLFCSPIRNQA